MIRNFAVVLLALAIPGSAAAKTGAFHLIPGAIPMDKGPDGKWTQKEKDKK